VALHHRLFTPALAVLAAAAVAACGSAGASPAPRQSSSSGAGHNASAADTSTGAARSASRPGKRATLVHVSLPVDGYPAALTARWQTITTIGGRPAVWIAVRQGVTLVRMNQRVAHLALHAGSVDPGGTGWRYGDAVAGREIHRLILGFNGGFKFSTGSGGFVSFGRVGAPLSAGYGSIVTYRNGTTQIGAWEDGVPARGLAIASVRQNLHLLIDHGVPDSSVASCGAACWGATIGNQAAVARSALGIRADGQLVWAAGESLTVGELADGMIAAGVQRAVQLDINPDWVAGYLYVHHPTGPVTPVPVVPGQYGIYGHLLVPYSRDFFTVLSN
jgi:Phosphodiester glycosidase